MEHFTMNDEGMITFCEGDVHITFNEDNRTFSVDKGAFTSLTDIYSNIDSLKSTGKLLHAESLAMMYKAYMHH